MSNEEIILEEIRELKAIILKLTGKGGKGRPHKKSVADYRKALRESHIKKQLK